MRPRSPVHPIEAAPFLPTQTLYLSNNQLTGTLDPAWGFPLTLQNLTLFANQFHGTIPSKWTLPGSLQVSEGPCLEPG